MALSRTRLLAVLDYNPRTGRFTWRVNGRGRFMREGAIAGTVNGKGYRQICIDGVIYQGGRLAFLWMTGRMPRRLAEHRNLNKADDRWRNLRPSNHSQNGANCLARVGKARAAPKGVTWDKSRELYAARIKVNYRTINLGRFPTAKLAHAAYVTAARKHFGEFARATRSAASFIPPEQL